jgi:hypothetical protein
VDTRVCVGYSPDPLFRIIPFDERWILITHPVYIVVTWAAALTVLAQAFRGNHAPALRWALSLCFMTTMRAATLLLIPLCRPTLIPFSSPPLTAFQTISLHCFSIPWRMFAVNDLVYSGHTAAYLLLLMATGTWFRIARVSLAVFLGFMIYGLLATREHYTIDILLAVPCSFFAMFLAVELLRNRIRYPSV